VSVVETTLQAPITAADTLNRAADLLEEFGWCQNALGSKALGEMCAVGALCDAHKDLGAGPEIFRDVLGALGLPLTETAADKLAGWNDASGRTKDQVVARFREAARRAA
jgi:hypothetical protein